MPVLDERTGSGGSPDFNKGWSHIGVPTKQRSGGRNSEKLAWVQTQTPGVPYLKKTEGRGEVVGGGGGGCGWVWGGVVFWGMVCLGVCFGGGVVGGMGWGCWVSCSGVLCFLVGVLGFGLVCVCGVGGEFLLCGGGGDAVCPRLYGRGELVYINTIAEAF